MEIQINSRNVAISEEQRESIVDRLEFAFEPHRSVIRLVRVTLTDVDGPRKGTDVLCRLKVVLQSRQEILVGDTELTMEKAVANVSARAARSIVRALDLCRQDAGVMLEDGMHASAVGATSD